MFFKELVEKNGHKLVGYGEAREGHTYVKVFDYSEKYGGTYDSHRYYNNYVVDVTKNTTDEHVEYAVEIYDSRGFNRQIDVYGIKEAAENFVKNADKNLKNCGEELTDDEYLVITYIEYDENENEIETGTYWSAKYETKE